MPYQKPLYCNIITIRAHPYPALLCGKSKTEWALYLASANKASPFAAAAEPVPCFFSVCDGVVLHIVAYRNRRSRHHKSILVKYFLDSTTDDVWAGARLSRKNKTIQKGCSVCVKIVVFFFFVVVKLYITAQSDPAALNILPM